MEKFDYAEDGNKVEKHDDVPERLREITYRYNEEATTRKQLKRKESTGFRTGLVPIRLQVQRELFARLPGEAKLPDAGRRGSKILL